MSYLGNRIKTLLPKSIGAGMLIGMGCVFSATIQNPVIGAILFSLGLLTILSCKLFLFTGIVGASRLKHTLDLILIFIGNILGTFVIYQVAVYSIPNIQEVISTVCLDKSTEPLVQMLLQAILCGALMQTAVVLFKRSLPVGTIMCVTGFILCGLEHSVANSFWMCCAGGTAYLYLLIYVVGNTVGAKLFYYFGVRD